MRLAWQYAHSTTAKAKRIWSTVIGPATATWATLNRLGWCFSGAFEFRDQAGHCYDVTKVSPLKIKKALYEAAKRWTVKMGLKSAGFEGSAQEVNRVEWKWAKKVLHGHQGGKAEERGGLEPRSTAQHGRKTDCGRQVIENLRYAHAGTRTAIRRIGLSDAPYTTKEGKE